MKCLNAIDSIIMEKGYEALTAENICKSTGLTRKAIDTYFGNLQTLLKMHDEVIMLEQFLKIKFGNSQYE